MPIIEHRPVNRRHPASDWIRRHAKNITSQKGQDGMIRAVFDKIGTTNKACCEFGAWDGLKFSNTFSLISQEKWSGYLIEGSKERCDRILENHKGNSVQAINTWISFEGSNTIDATLEKAGAPYDIDLMVIDIDGNDYHVWDSMVKFRPRLLLVEFNPMMDNDVLFIQDRDWHVRQGSSLLAMIELGKSKGYELVATAGDGFFVRKEDFHKLEIPNNSIDSLHFNGNRITRLFQGYDGKFWVTGNRRFRLNDEKVVEIPNDYFQVH